MVGEGSTSLTPSPYWRSRRRRKAGFARKPCRGDRSLSPPPPEKARRGWDNPVARWMTYILVVIALTFVFLVLLVDIFHLG